MKNNPARKLILLILMAWMGLALLPLTTRVAAQQVTLWSEPAAVSIEGEWSWFPDLALDPYGTLHAIWCWTRPHPNSSGLIEQVKYGRMQNGVWENVNDIAAPSADIERNALAADQLGRLHITYGGSAYGDFEIQYQRALVADAWSAQGWSAPFRLNQGGGYHSDIAVDSKGSLHVIFDDLVYQKDADLEDVVLSDIYYRRSTDGGETWTWPHAFQPLIETGSARPALQIDQNDVIHVTWDEGWDRLTGNQSEAFYSVYTFSTDHGETWSEPREIDYPDRHAAQLTAGSNNHGGVVLVWRSMEQAEIFFQWSGDQGRTWSVAQPIPGIFAREWMFPHDMYYMATDSAGRIHLFVAGRISIERDTPVGIYDLIWDGIAWSVPVEIFKHPELFPFYPKAVVKNGNELHLTWFTKKDNEWQEDVDRVIWYSWRSLDAPQQIVNPWPTYTPTLSPVPPTRIPRPSNTPPPDFNAIATPPADTWVKSDPYTEIDELSLLGLSLLPVVLLMGVILLIRWIQERR